MSNLQRSVFLSTLAGCLIWTGFPVFYQSTFHSKYSVSELYLYAVSGSLLFSLIGGVLADLLDFRKMAVLSQIVSIICLLVVFFFFLDPLDAPNPIWILVPMYFNFSLYQITESTWLLKCDQQEDLKDRILDRSRLLLVAKLVGFGFGPIVFLSLGKVALLLSGILYLLSIALQIRLIQKSGRVRNGVLERLTIFELCLSIKNEIRNPKFVFATLATGALSIPLNTVFVDRLLELSAPNYVSPFWVLGGISSFLILFMLKRIGFSKIWKLLMPTSIMLAILVVVGLSASHPLLLVTCSTLYIGLNTLYSFSLQHSVCAFANQERLGTALGTYNFFLDAGVQLGMLVAAFSPLTRGPLLTIMCFVILVRWLLLVAYTKSSRA